MLEDCGVDKIQILRYLTAYFGVTPEELLDQPARNPHVQHLGVISRQDVIKGAKILVIGHDTYPRALEIEVSDVFIAENGKEMLRCSSGAPHKLDDLGIVTDEEGSWNPFFATFPNDATTRQAVTRWLASKGGAATQSASKLLKQYPQDFPTEPIVDALTGTIVARMKQ